MVSSKTLAAARTGVAAALLFLFAIILAAPLPASNIPNETAQQHEAVAQKFVKDTLRVWKDRLNLKDWDITVSLVHPSALEPKTLGNIHWDTDARHADIGVLSTFDYTLPWPDMLNDMEVTIVHELVHLQLASLPRSDASRRNEEYAVNQITHALLDLSKR